jgi:cyclic pyranopterin phosphate synthase
VTSLLDKPLIDSFGRLHDNLRLSVTDRCNIRCFYCMPETDVKFQPREQLLTFEEIERFVRVAVTLGVRKLRLTGGEPLVRKDLARLVRKLVAIEGIEDIALTTNGMLLARYATELKAAGLKRITVSLDTLDPEVFAKMSGGFGGVSEVLDGIEHARRAGLAPIKINTVVQRGVNDHTLLDLLAHFRGTGVIVRFIEYMDVGTRNHWNPALVVPSRELAARIQARWPIEARQRDYRGEVAERYAFADGAGEIGFISSVSQPFCGDCSRARISSDGSFYTCLFATQGVDLRGPLRAGATDEELYELVRGIWSGRRDRYSELRASMRDTGELHKVEMNYIGG